MNKVIFIIVNDPLFISQHLHFLFPYLYEYNIYFISNTPSATLFTPRVLSRFLFIPIRRDPSLSDLLTLFSFVFLRLRYQPSIVLSFTPKAALINSLSSILSGRSIHYFTGQRWATYSGLKLFIFKLIDKFVFLSCNTCYCDSVSQSHFLASSLNIPLPLVIGQGSISGVDLSQFTPFSTHCSSKIDFLRSLYDYNFHDHSFLFGFVGRINFDKGIFTLLSAFEDLSLQLDDVYLILVGPLELKGSDLHRFNLYLQSNSRIIYIPFVIQTSLYYKSFDVFILPSFREGFGTVVLEAAASHIPIISSNIPGPTDFITHDVNGILFEVGSSIDLLFAMRKLFFNGELRSNLSTAAYKLVKTSFDRNILSKQFLDSLFDLE